MELKRIKMSDIIPDEHNPRRNLGDIKEFAAALTTNPWSPGEPFNPIIVVRDGLSYRLADGERRYRAMLHNGVEECSAVVCGDYDEAQSAIVALATDSKKPLSEIERSRAVQSALALGVEPKKVEAAGGLKRGQARKIAEAAKWAGEKALQSTLDQLLASNELEKAGASREEARSVLEADPDAWKDMERAIKGELSVRKRAAALQEVLDEQGIAPASPDGEMAYVTMLKDPKALKERIESEGRSGEQEIYCIDSANGFVDVYRMRKDEDDEIPAHLAKAAAIAEDAVSQGAQNRADWYMKCLKRRPGHPNERVQLTPHVDELICSWFDSVMGITASYQYMGHDPEELAKPKVIFAPFALYAFEDVQDSIEIGGGLVRKLALGEDVDADEQLSVWVEWVQAFVFDGFELSADETELFDKANGAIGTYAPLIDHREDTPAAAEPITLDVPERAEETRAPSSEPADLIDIADLNFGQAVA